MRQSERVSHFEILGNLGAGNGVVPDKTVEHYRAAREPWQGADADFQPVLETIAALRRLGAED